MVKVSVFEEMLLKPLILFACLALACGQTTAKPDCEPKRCDNCEPLGMYDYGDNEVVIR